MNKTLIISLEYPPQVGGIASYVSNFAQHMPAGEAVVYAPRMAGDKVWDSSATVKTYRHNPYWVLWPRWLRMYFQVKKIVKTEKIQEIHVHHVLPVGYVAYILKRTLKIPFIIFLHGTDLEMATRGAGKTKKFARLCREATRVVVNSEFMKHKLDGKVEGLVNVVVVHPSPGDIFLNEPDQTLLTELKSKLALNGKKVMITVARFAEGKGYPHLIRLLPQILQTVPNLVWLVIGDGPKKLELVNMVQKHSLQNVVRFLGQMDYKELPLYYHLADLYVLLTHKDESAEEGWGTSFLEAAACGLPVVAGRVGGVEEAVEHLVTGLLVDTYQDMSVVAAVTDLLRESDYAKKMGAAGRDRVMSEFTWDKQMKIFTN